MKLKAFLVSGALLILVAGGMARFLAAAPKPESPPEALDLDTLEQQAFRAAAEQVADAVVRIETVGGLERVHNVLFGTGPTTGVVIDKEGYIVSSAFNFVNKPASILVRLPDGTRKAAELVSTDHNRMIALLKIPTDKPLPVPAVAPESELRVGQWAIAVGRTFDSARPNITVGIVSALGRIWGKAIQTDAAVSPNNYGGPLVDIRGRAMGIIVPLSPQRADEVAGVEWYDSGIGFAIPLEFILKNLPRMKREKDLYPGVIGITMGNLETGEAKIAACQPGSPAALAGLKVGDVIVEIDGQPISRAADVKREISRRYAGDTMRIVVHRDKERIERTVELVAKLEPYQLPFLGILPIRGGDRRGGVAVRYVYPKSPAAAAGIMPGDIILALGGKPTLNAEELREAVAMQRVDAEVELDVRHGDRTQKVKLKLGTLPETLPPEELPPAHPEIKPEGERPKTGLIELKVAEFSNEVLGYVPEGYHESVAHGILVWLHPAGGYDRDELLARWKPLCDRSNLILIAPKAGDPQKWVPGEAALAQQLIEQVQGTYYVDARRIAVAGYEAGGTMAWTTALRNRETVRAAVVIAAATPGRPAPTDSLHPFAVYLAWAKKKSTESEQAVAQLRAAKIPVTTKELGPDPRDLDAQECAELARWLDMLDRI
jgi:serine protease Do